MTKTIDESGIEYGAALLFLNGHMKIWKNVHFIAGWSG